MSESRGNHVLAFLAVAVLMGVVGFILGRMQQQDELELPINTKTVGQEISTQPQRSIGHVSRDSTDTAEEDGVSPKERKWMLDALKKERIRQEASEIYESDTGLTVLNKVLKYEADWKPLFTNFENFSGHLRVSPEEELLIPVTPETANKIFGEFRRSKQSRVIFDLAPGIYNLNASLYLEDLEFITLRGKGMDDTILNTSGDLVFTKGVDNLKIEDLTLDSSRGSDGIIDSRGASALLLSGVRIKGFDSAGGHSSALGLSGKSYIAAENCEFLGGYGRRPYSGSAISLRNQGFAYFKNCSFRELDYFLIADGPIVGGSVVKLEGCRSQYDNFTGRYSEGVTVVMRGCNFESFGSDRLAGGKLIDGGGNQFAPISKGTFSSLGDALARFQTASIVEAKVIENMRGDRQNPAYFVATDANGEVGRYFNDPNRGPQLRKKTTSSPRGLGRPTISVGNALGLALDQLQQQADASFKSIRGIRLSQSSINGSRGLIWKVDTRAGMPVKIDATTGAILTP